MVVYPTDWKHPTKVAVKFHDRLKRGIKSESRMIRDSLTALYRLGR